MDEPRREFALRRGGGERLVGAGGGGTASGWNRYVVGVDKAIL